MITLPFNKSDEYISVICQDCGKSFMIDKSYTNVIKRCPICQSRANKNQNRTCGCCGRKFPMDRLKYVSKEKSRTSYLCYECFGDFTKSDHRLIKWAVENIIKKYCKQSGKSFENDIEGYITLSSGTKEIESVEYIDYFFCQMLVYQGKNAVRQFVENYTYNPAQKKQPV